MGAEVRPERREGDRTASFDGNGPTYRAQDNLPPSGNESWTEPVAFSFMIAGRPSVRAHAAASMRPGSDQAGY